MGRWIGLVALGRPEIHLDGPPSPATSRFVIARTDEQAVEPGLELLGVAQRGQVAPGGHESLLGRVHGSLWIAQDQPGGGIEPADRDARQLT